MSWIDSVKGAFDPVWRDEASYLLSPSLAPSLPLSPTPSIWRVLESVDLSIEAMVPFDEWCRHIGNRDFPEYSSQVMEKTD